MGTSKRGLASADEETRRRVASAGGRASHGGRGRDAGSRDNREGQSTNSASR